MTQKSLFDNPRFKWWLTSRFATNFGKQMLSLIVYWQVYDLTKDPLSLGCLGLAEYVPFLALAFWAGHLADMRERRGLLIFSQIGQFISAITLFSMCMFWEPAVWIIYLMVGLAGAFSSLEVAAAGSYVQTWIPKDIFPKAAAWNLTLFNTATILGPIFGGWVIAHQSVQMAYLLTTIFFTASCLAAWMLPKIHPTKSELEVDSSAWQRMKAGIRFIMSERMLLGSMSLDLVAVLFGGAVALFPIFADILKVGPVGLGVLQAAQAVGSFGVALVQTRVSSFKTNWNNLCHTVTLFGICMIGFAFSNYFYLSVLLLIIAGASDGVSVIIRSSILQARTPDHMRGRVVAVGSVFIRSSNELGGFESGVMAKWMGTVPSVVFGGIMTLVSVFAMRKTFPDLKTQSANS